MNNSKSFIALLTAALLTITSGISVAQNTTSPYSRFGYGLLNDNATSAQSQMGGVGYAMNSGRQINVMNPASYAMTDSLTFLFDLGVDISNVWSKENAESKHDVGGGLDYITMQFPICKRMGMSIGLLPFSSVGYSFGSKISNGSSSHEGTGGLNQLYVGVAGRIVGGLSAGANIGYLFGTTYNDVYATTNSASQSLFEQILQVRDFRIQLGAQYSHDFSRRHRVTLGLTYTPGKTLLGHTWIQKYDVNSDAKPDTLNYTSLKDKFSLPETWGAGIAYEYNRSLLVEADFTYQGWSKAKLLRDDDFTSTRFADRYKFALGASYTPNRRGSYMQRVSYRFGGHYTRDYMMVGDNHVREYGLACGFGFPAPGSKTVFNIGFEWLRRACTSASLLSENYFNIRIGINFNQMWFMQSKLR